MYSIEREYNSIVYKGSDETLYRPTLPGVVNCRWSRAGRPEGKPGGGCRGVTVSCNWAKDEKAHDRPYSFSYRGQFFSLSGFLYSRVGTQAPSYINTSNTEFSSYSIGDETELPTFEIPTYSIGDIRYSIDSTEVPQFQTPNSLSFLYYDYRDLFNIW